MTKIAIKIKKEIKVKTKYFLKTVKQCSSSLLAPANGEIECTNSNFVGSSCTYKCEPMYKINNENIKSTCINSEKGTTWIQNLQPNCTLGSKTVYALLTKHFFLY